MSRNDAPSHNTMEGMLRDLNKRMATAETYLHRHGSNDDGLYFRGVRGELAYTPDHADLDLQTMCLVAHVAANDWSPGSTTKHIMGKNSPTNSLGAGQLSYRLQLNGFGQLQYVYSIDGTTVASFTSTANLSAYANGAPLWVAAAFVPDNGAGGRQCRMWTSLDGIIWTLFHDSGVLAGTRVVFNSAARLAVGAAHDESTYWEGQIFYAEVRNGDSPTTGAIVASFDGRTAVRGRTQTDPTGKVWTVVDPHALGVIAVGALWGSEVVIAGSASANITLMMLTAIPFRFGRRYRLTMRIRATTAGTGQVILRASSTGADLPWGDYWHAAHANFNGFTAEFFFDGDGLSYQPTARFVNGTGSSISVYADSNGGLMIEDVGPSLI